VCVSGGRSGDRIQSSGQFLNNDLGNYSLKYLSPEEAAEYSKLSSGHMCETFPPNKREVCLVARASIKVGSENRLPYAGEWASSTPSPPRCDPVLVAPVLIPSRCCSAKALLAILIVIRRPPETDVRLAGDSLPQSMRMGFSVHRGWLTLACRVESPNRICKKTSA
jgi:hypothetical protein